MGASTGTQGRQSLSELARLWRHPSNVKVASMPRRALILTVPLFGVLAALLVLEIVIRCVDALSGPAAVVRPTSATTPSRWRWVPHPFLPYAGRPNAMYDIQNDDGSGEQIVYNSYGFRAHEFPKAKRPEDFIVLCFGESSTYGYKTATNALTWPERLEQRLQQRYPQRRVRVFNLGLDMASSAFSIVNLALVGVHLEPDLVIVYHGFNEISVLDSQSYRWDHAHAFHDLDTRGQYDFQAMIPTWLRGSRALVAIAGKLDEQTRVEDLYDVARHPVVAADSLLPELDALLVNYETLHSLARGAGSNILFSTFQFRAGEGLPEQRFNQSLRRMFEARGWPFVDQDALLPDNDPSINIDACHFTQEGNERMAENFFDYIVAHGLIAPRPPTAAQPELDGVSVPLPMSALTTHRRTG